MPKCVDGCCAALEAGGMDPRKARSACSIAFWQAHGMRPKAADATGLDPDTDLTGAARSAAAALAEADDFGVARSDLRELTAANLDDYANAAKPADDTPREMREVLVMTPGTYGWAEHTWTLADLQEIVRNFDPSDPPPVQLDHSYSARDTVGYVRGLRLAGESLYALAEFVGADPVERVRTGLYRKVSAGLLISPIQALRELSVTPFPAVPHAAITKEEMTMAIGATPVPPASPPTVTPAPVASLSETPAPAEATLAADQTTIDLRATLEAQQARIAQLEAQQAEQAKLSRQAQDNADYIELCQSGKTVPAAKDLELKILASLTPEQRPDYLALRKELPSSAWPTGRTATADLSRDGSGRAQEDDEVARLSARLNPAATSSKLASATK